MSAMDDIAISVAGVGKCYRVFDSASARIRHHLSAGPTSGMREVWALRDINFKIKRGESVAIIGRNGGGKSTLLEILTGTLTPTTGSVSVNGRVSALLELGSGFNPEYSGRDNVILNGLLLGLTKEDILSRFTDIEAFAEIGAAIDRPVKTYSSGMMVRLAFAVQVLSDPDILIIDEALSVGDFFFQQKCLTYIRKLRDRGVTVIFVSHDMSTVRDLCARGIFLNAGQVAFDGDNLEAVQLYLANGRVDLSPVSRDTVSEDDALNLVVPRVDEFQHWLWSPAKAPCLGSTHIAGVDILDSHGRSTTSIQMGGEMVIRTQFTVEGSETADVMVAIKNRHGNLITALGSFTIGKPLPKAITGTPILSEIRIEMALEAGPYSVCVSLARPSENRTTGTTLDETPWLGPIQVTWPYEEKAPPFYGMVGLKATSAFFATRDQQG
jgi:lipopolysaccharide transport system ATP-binding protein